MFVRADQLLLEQLEDKLPVHVLEFFWDGFDPKLLGRDLSTNKVSEVELGTVGYTVGQSRRCVGRWEDDEYIPCPSAAVLEGSFSQCSACAEESFIPFQECVFDPKCEGDQCDIEFCKREHVLYLAFYGTMVKIGMSSTRRVDRRLVEQGADAYAIIGSYPNRFRAREAEKDISSRMKIPQGIRQQRLLDNFVSPLDLLSIEARLRSLSEDLAESYGLEVEPIRALSGYPIDLPLRATPKLVETPGRHRGKLLGIKGKWLVYESNGVKALNLSDLPGRRIAAEK